jgi:1-acyl-sn-glycerol-3-phosphate acyltransferase
VSWLDIFLLNAVRPTVFVAKSEIRRWPVYWAGWSQVPTRSLSNALRVMPCTRSVWLCKNVLQRAQAVGLFPEGTTSQGYDLLPFYANLFEPARKAHTLDTARCTWFFFINARAQRFRCICRGTNARTQLVASTWVRRRITVEVEFLAPVWVPDGSEAPPRAELGSR